jgi:chromosome segregation ATPase
LQKQRQEEENTMKKLIEDNVRMEREVKKADQRVQEIHTKMALIKLEIEAEKEKTREKEARIKEMENEMTMLILAKKSEKKKGKGAKAEAIENQSLGITDKYTGGDPTIEKYERKIKDLNLRLKRLAEDDEVKDQRIANLEEQLEGTVEYADELEKELGADVVAEIKKRLEEKRKNKNIHYYDPANVVKSNGDVIDQQNRQSAVCVLQ